MTDIIRRVAVGEKEILLIPTAHVSPASVALVRDTIEAEQPDSVCIELDAKRYENIRNPKKWESTDILHVIKSGQTGYLLVTLALSAYQRKMAANLKSQVGGEMMQGMKSAEEIGAELVLADRDIQTTFLRIWRKLSLWEKCKLLVTLLLPSDEDEITEDETLQAMLEGDALEAMMAEMRKEFPKIGDILIRERDEYLAGKIREAPGKKIVAVLGAAHVPGVVQALDKPIDMEEISTLPPKRPIGRILAWAIPIVVIALLAYAFVQSAQTGLRQLLTWLLWNGGLSALGTLLALGHPLSILTAFVVAPVTSLNPLLAAGWFAGLVQATVQKPTVADAQDAFVDILSLRGIWKNKLIKVLLVVILANVGSSLGTFLAGAEIIRNLF